MIVMRETRMIVMREARMIVMNTVRMIVMNTVRMTGILSRYGQKKQGRSFLHP
jgi:hypothetical protein